MSSNRAEKRVKSSSLLGQAGVYSAYRPVTHRRRPIMLLLRYLVSGALVLLLAGCTGVRGIAPAVETAPGMGTVATQRVTTWFEAHRDRPPLLRMFLQRMPKG